MCRVALIFGTRPEIIKVAPVYLKAKEMGIDVTFVCTGQHREMVDMMKSVFNVDADYDMNIMTQNQTLNDVASRVIAEFQKYASNKNFDWVLVQGDTTTAMASAIAAFNMGIKVGHIEAGLRSGNLYDPFPEEMNRRVIDQLSELMFAPTQRARQTLLNEGFEDERIIVTGNTVVDAQMYVLEHFDLSGIRKRIVENDNYFLVTLHRRENIGERMHNVLRAMRKFSQETGLEIVFPVHKNPRVRQIVAEELGDFKLARLIEPVDYVTSTALIQGARFVATDSGGIQEEAPTFKKLVVVCRETTERPEVIDSRFGILAGTSEDGVYDALKMTLEMGAPDLPNPFGDGNASQRILSAILGGN